MSVEKIVQKKKKTPKKKMGSSRESWPCEAYQLRSGVANKPHKASQKSIRQNKKKNSSEKRGKKKKQWEREGEKTVNWLQ